MPNFEVQMTSDDEILTCDEASAFLKVSNKTVLKLARDGELPGQKVGRAWRFSRSELVAYVACRATDSSGVTA
jgi:excisionase family DNA binding protein